MATALMDDSEEESIQKIACVRCHAQKVRCTRRASRTSCKRCHRAQIECVPRPSRRRRVARHVPSPGSDRSVVSPGIFAYTPVEVEANAGVSNGLNSESQSITVGDLLAAGNDGLHVAESTSDWSFAINTMTNLEDADFCPLDHNSHRPLPSSQRPSGTEVMYATPNSPEDFLQSISGTVTASTSSLPSPLTPPSSYWTSKDWLNDLQRTQLSPLHSTEKGNSEIWLQRLARLNLLFEDYHQAVLRVLNKLHSFVGSDPKSHHHPSTLLPTDKLFRSALDLLRLMRAPVSESALEDRRYDEGFDTMHGYADTLLLLSTYTRLLSTLGQVLECLRLILVYNNRSPQMPLQFLPPSHLSHMLDSKEHALQIHMVVEGIAFLIRRLSTSINLYLEGSTTRLDCDSNAASSRSSTHQGMHRAVRAMSEALRSEQENLSKRIESIKEALQG